MIASGRLRELISVSRQSHVSLPDGSQDIVWLNILQTYCDVRQETASIDVQAGQDNIAQRIRFYLRWRGDVPLQIGDRLTWRNREFKIHGFEWDIMRTKLIVTSYTHNETTNAG